MSGQIIWKAKIWKAKVDCENKTEHAMVQVVQWEDEFGSHRTIDVEEADYLSIDDAEVLATTITEAITVARRGAP